MPAPIDLLVPPRAELDAPLRRALSRDATARLARARRAWARIAGAPPSIRPSGELAGSGAFRRWLAAVEDALAIVAEAAPLVRLPPADRRRRRGWSRLVERIADEGILARLAPEGRIPDDFPEKALRVARRRLAAHARALPGVVREARRAAARGEPAIGRTLVDRGLAAVEGRRAPAFARRVAAALALLDAAWPAGASLVRSRCWRVVPVEAWGTVSYSSPREPGVAYVDVRSAPAVRVAEDLVHESVHMRLHEIEATTRLVSAAAREGSGRAPRFYSPWRREWRPLRGIVHAACTFTAGEIFFERMLASGGPFSASRRLWLARRLLEERESVRRVLPVLRGAGRRGLLAAGGRRVVEAVSRAHRGEAARARRVVAALAATPEGRREIARVDRFAATLAKRPVRPWGAGPDAAAY